MTVPSKGLRSINVDGEEYRWKGIPVTYEEPKGLKLLLCGADRKGQIAFVFFPTDVVKDFFLDPYEKIVWEEHDLRPLTPERVAYAIRECRRIGWSPSSSGPTLNFEFAQDHSKIKQLMKV